MPVQTHDTTKHNAGSLVHRRWRRRRRSPNVEISPPIGAHWRLQSAARGRHMLSMSPHPIHRRRKERIDWFFRRGFSYYFSPVSLPPDTTRGHCVYHHSDTVGLTGLRSNLFQFNNTLTTGYICIKRQVWQINNNIVRMICSDDCPKTTQPDLEKMNFSYVAIKKNSWFLKSNKNIFQLLWNNITVSILL